jgi:2-keto-3-deoxy-L-arabinonate dehydratase
MPKDLLRARGSSAIPMTPFDERDEIDVPTLRREMQFILRAHASSVCVPVMVSEFDALSERERKLMVEVACEEIAGRRPVIACATAPNAAQAADYGRFAAACGADAVISMAPKGWEFDRVREYFSRLSEESGLPVMIQNAGIPGVQLFAAQVAALAREIPGVTWVKQEVAPGPPGITEVTEACKEGLVGTMSGFGALYSPTDRARGATATIHACEFCDAVQRVWDLLDAGREEEGRDLHCALLPALQLESLLGMMYAKEIMVRRGVFEKKHVRLRTRRRPLHEMDLREIDRVWERTRPLLQL